MPLTPFRYRFTVKTPKTKRLRACITGNRSSAIADETDEQNTFGVHARCIRKNVGGDRLVNRYDTEPFIQPD